MANIKSAKKRIRVIERKTLRNKMIKSALKTQIKKFEAAVANKNVEEATEQLKLTYKALDMAASKNVLHKNVARRKKSRLTANLNKLNA